MDDINIMNIFNLSENDKPYNKYGRGRPALDDVRPQRPKRTKTNIMGRPKGQKDLRERKPRCDKKEKEEKIPKKRGRPFKKDKIEKVEEEKPKKKTPQKRGRKRLYPVEFDYKKWYNKTHRKISIARYNELLEIEKALKILSLSPGQCCIQSTPIESN